jgi:hypothetical protein
MTSDTSSDRKNGRLPNGKWPPGVSGNPKGRKPKNPANDLDDRSALDQALDKTVKVKHGEKTRRITKRTLILDQWVNQAANGDHRARRELIAHCEKRDIELFAGQHKAFQDAVAKASSSTVFILTEEMLDRLSESTLDELTRVKKELEAENKRKMN